MSENFTEEVTKLGGLLAEFRASRAVVSLCWFLGVLALLFCLWALGFIAYLVVDPAAKGPQGRFSVKLVFGCIAALSAGIGCLRKARSASRLHVFVCVEGIVCQQRDRTEVMRWEDVNEVQRVVDTKSKQLVVTSASQLVLVDRTGRQLVFNETVSGLRELRQLVEEQTLKFMLPPALEAFASGAVIGFGEVSVSADGLQIGRETLPWQQFESAEVSKGQLIIYDNSRGKKRFGRVELAKVPNPHVLLALAEQARPQQS